MFKSTGARYLLVGFLVLLMFVPLFFVGEVVNSRKYYSQDTSRQIGEEWGGVQSLSGPFLEIPVLAPTEVVDRKRLPNVAVGNDAVNEVMETVEQAISAPKTVEFKRIELREKNPLYLLPLTLDIDVSSTTQTRRRGIFEVPVYSAKGIFRGEFDVSGLEKTLNNEEQLVLDKTRLIFSLSKNKALRGNAVLKIDGKEYPLEPRTGIGGLYADIENPTQIKSFELTLEINGAQEFKVAPLGRNTKVTMNSEWPHPSFIGAFLPDTHEIHDNGFTAMWQIPHFARSIPQISRANIEQLSKSSSFGYKLFQPNDFYQKAYRSARYGILFIALTFLTILLLENKDSGRVHPVQYLLVGLSQSVFVLLMVAYAEQIGFSAAYLSASIATIVLLTLFAIFALKLGRRSWVVCGMLIVVYAVLYLILKSADYALIAGSTLAFLAIAATMYFTRNEDWNARTEKMSIKAENPVNDDP